ncbi:hypothetical protein HPB47_008511 [Ixodes persulcatus]|uniref:Uncharacterized protein n=1 Tax=Ixodes persulcatus TaxID=34615 RepID=A0AC60P4Y3_IXOPE|nr:hypothetical protein HPB47_008511 [Ixodes persulcatus]
MLVVDFVAIKVVAVDEGGASPPVRLRTLQRRHSRTDAGSSDNEVLPPPTVSSSGSPGDGGGYTGPVSPGTGPVSPGTGPPRLRTGVLEALFGTRNASQPLANVAATDPRMPAPANGTRAQQGDPSASDPVFRGWSQSPAEQHRQDESSPHGGGPHGGALASSDPLERRRAQCAAEREHEHSGVTVASIRWQFVSMPYVFTVFIILAGLTKLPTRDQSIAEASELALKAEELLSLERSRKRSWGIETLRRSRRYELMGAIGQRQKSTTIVLVVFLSLFYRN